MCFLVILRVRMMGVKELHDMEPAAVHIKVDVTLFEIGRYGFPHLDLRIHFFYRTPCGIADSLAVSIGGDKQNLQLAMTAVNFYDKAANRLGAGDSVCLP